MGRMYAYRPVRDPYREESEKECTSATDANEGVLDEVKTVHSGGQVMTGAEAHGQYEGHVCQEGDEAGRRSNHPNSQNYWRGSRRERAVVSRDDGDVVSLEDVDGVGQQRGTGERDRGRNERVAGPQQVLNR